MTKFKVGDKVIADGDEAVITQIILPDDRNWDDPGMPVWYAVEWPTNEWGTFSEDELRRVGGGMNERIRQIADNATHYANGVCDADTSTVLLFVNPDCDYLGLMEAELGFFELYPNPTRVPPFP